MYHCRLCHSESPGPRKGDRWCADCRSALVLFRRLRRQLRRGPRPADLAERLARFARRAAAGEPLFSD
jgi:hypothetical protein